jgi:bacterioferritin (cytochrome b1)
VVIGKVYPIQWRESRVNLTELAKLRYLDGWSRQRLAQHFNKNLNSITNHCQSMKRKNFNLEGLTDIEKEKIRWASKN